MGSNGNGSVSVREVDGVQEECERRKECKREGVWEKGVCMGKEGPGGNGGERRKCFQFNADTEVMGHQQDT